MRLTTASGIGLSGLPRLTTTVPKEYVHRASLAEVFLTGCTTHDDLRFSLTGQWPRAHTHFNSSDGTSHDPLQAAETFRQASIFMAHTALDVPLGHQFVMWNLSYTTDPDGLRIASSPTDFDIEARCIELVHRKEAVSRIRMDLSLHRDGVLVAHGATEYGPLPPAVYARIRARRTVPVPEADGGTTPDSSPLPPAYVGRSSAADVVLTATDTPRRWLLTPNLDHPILFDHGADHVPGMVLMEGARQAASALVGPRSFIPASASSNFRRYVELDRPCWIDITQVASESGSTMTVEVTGHQDGESVFTSTLTGPVS
ncbi:ScbA/BarX family gamma-butyrolactone biosynthesis protein [Streptomyces sp. NPDC058964]|uniref:ScbA/BarX family gamma-butyrolactone biosynthesis protein n=1 Tax=Streptomyces sp. NPDC058964 TaxID=3346681 RepID=UPI0036AB69BE